MIAGFDKNGISEQSNLTLKPGEVTCLVGPTGSGKSRLLADIEWMAYKDTPSKRSILINSRKPNEQIIQFYGGKLVAQITQSMNFVLDMNVQNFIKMHAESRFLNNTDEIVDEVIQIANELSGEQFYPNTPVTFLSGGQSRALMVADVLCIGKSPIVLIDEIENAGLDKRKVLDLLINKEKIVLMATHDPLLILLADQRVILKNGGIQRVVKTTKAEMVLRELIEEFDNKIQKTRNFLREGNTLNDIVEKKQSLSFFREVKL